METTEPFMPPDPNRRWSTERQEHLRKRYPQHVLIDYVLVELNAMVGLPININQAAAYASKMLKVKRSPEAARASRCERMRVMNAARQELVRLRESGVETPEAAESRRLLMLRRTKEREKRAELRAYEKREGAAAAAEERKHTAERRARLAEMFLADQDRLEIQRLQQERAQSRTAPASRPARQRDPSKPTERFTMAVMTMPDPRIAAYEQQRSAASRGRVSDGYVAPLTHTLPE